jgi:hypothetical protein
MTDATVHFATTVVCDDIRMEMSRKLILIGVYPLDIAVAKFPAQFPLVVFASGEVTAPGDVTAPLKVTDESGTVLFETDKAITPKMMFTIGGFTMQANAILAVNKESVLHFYFVVNGTDILVAKKRVQVESTIPRSPVSTS